MTPEDELQLRIDVVRACKWLNNQRVLKKAFFAEYADLTNTALTRAEEGKGPIEKLERLLFAISEYRTALENVHVSTTDRATETVNDLKKRKKGVKRK